MLYRRSLPRWCPAAPDRRLNYWSAPSPDPAVWLPLLLSDLAERSSRLIAAHQNDQWKIVAWHKPKIIRRGCVRIEDGKVKWIETSKNVVKGVSKAPIPWWAKK
jgi:hypothetical protein